MAQQMTLADHADAWWREQGKEVPSRDTAEWQQMYEAWATWAFADLRGPEETRPRERHGKQK
jgi:hypothetical protein